MVLRVIKDADDELVVEYMLMGLSDQQANCYISNFNSRQHCDGCTYLAHCTRCAKFDRNGKLFFRVPDVDPWMYGL
jgi:hypothetical protein